MFQIIGCCISKQNIRGFYGFFQLTFVGGLDKIEYIYNAIGQKLEKKVTELAGSGVTTTQYVNGFQYKENVLLFFPHAEGYVNNTVVSGVNNYNYVYNYTDHLGNIRLSYTQDPVTPSSLKILEENHYYPFGLKHTNYNTSKIRFEEQLGKVLLRTPSPTATMPYQYKYNGKEYQDELGLNLTAMDFRQYDNAIGRFNVIDPLAEQDFGTSAYAFAGNNPVLFGDPSGLKAQAPDAIENNMVAGSVLSMYCNGMNGREISQQLQQQMWGPGFIVGLGGCGAGDARGFGGGGGVHALTIDPKTGERGYWEKRYVGNKDIPTYDKDPNDFNLGEVTIQPMYKKVWVGNVESGLAYAFLGLGLSVGEEMMYNENTWFSLRMMKSYSQSFNGNGYTWGKNAVAKRVSTGFKVAGYAFGVYNAVSTLSDYNNKKFDGTQFAIEEASNAYSTFGGIYGAAWGIGWELGRATTNTGWYQNWKQNTWLPWRYENYGY